MNTYIPRHGEYIHAFPGRLQDYRPKHADRSKVLNPLYVTCPVCDAGVGEPCMSYVTPGTHIARDAKARQEPYTELTVSDPREAPRMEFDVKYKWARKNVFVS